VFSGVGGLTFNGTGTTIFTGANTYSGGTTVASGTLAVAGASPTGTGAVYVASAGTLMGTGTIGGNLTVAGILKPGNSPGYLVASSNVSMNAGSTYQQDIAGLTQANSTTPVGATGYYSLLSVGGQFTINTGATLAPRLSNLFSASESGYGTAIYVPSLGDRFRIVTATGGILGRFSTLTQPAELVGGTQFIAFYNVNSSNSVELAITPTSYSTTLLANTTNIKDVAKVLDQLLGVNKSGAATAAQDSLLYAVAGQTAGSLPGFAQGLSGEIHAASAATLPQAAQRVQQAVLARLGDYPMAPSQLNPALNNALLTGGISATNPSGLPTANMSTNPAVNPNTVNVTSAAVKDGRAWGEIAYQRAERASNSAGNGYNSNLYQIVTGVDAYSNAELGLKLGGGIALSNTTVSANGGNSTIQQGSLFAYGKMPVLQDYVLDGMASVGMSSTNLSRNDPTGYTGGFSSKAVLGSDALISVGLSRAFEYNDVRVTPYARLTYQYVGQNSYNEGSGVAALNIASFSGSAARGVIGVAAGSLNKEPLKDDYTYRANVSVGADTSGLLNPTLNTTLGGFSSSVTTATAGSAFVQVGLYGTVKISDNAYAYAGVSGEARSGQTLYGGSVGLRMAF
jgi:autotransporter-associated beta strand protein